MATGSMLARSTLKPRFRAPSRSCLCIGAAPARTSSVLSSRSLCSATLHRRAEPVSGQSSAPPKVSWQFAPRHLQGSSGLRLRFVSTSSALAPPDPERVATTRLRNISIIAHIDAGKTTLTERLLHLTNALSPPVPGSKPGSGGTPGDVDSGSTVTDFLEQERQRGITIQSAAVGPVWWTPSTVLSPTTNQDQVGITLVDTPGHIDFGIEVERALRVVDGAVVVLDGVEGVEAQTEMVWRQAARYDVKSLLLFVNKLDRTGASLSRSVRSILASGLHHRPVVLQLPLPPTEEGAEEGIGGVLDLLTMQKLTFSGKAGEIVSRSPLTVPNEASASKAETMLFREATKARHALVEALASLDDQLLEELFSQPSGSDEEPHALIPADSIGAALRRQTLEGNVLPVLCGSAAKNIGVQPLLDAVAAYLPSPNDKAAVVGTAAALQGARRGSGRTSKPQPQQSSSSGEAAAGRSSGEPAGGGEAAGGSNGTDLVIPLSDPRTTLLAFKVVHDKRRGPITFVRIYSGTLQRSTSLFNTTTQTRERLARVLLPFADQYIETNTLRAGQIGVLLGLKDTRTGDTLVDARATGSGSKTAGEAADFKTLRLKRVHVPPPVFSMSVEPRSKSDEAAVLEALSMLVRTDPSLRLDEGGSSGTSAGAAAASAGTGTGQTVLSGMGELHLEIARDRLENEFNVRASMGGVRVSYRETLSDAVDPVEGLTVEDTLDREMGGKRVKVGCRLHVRPLAEGETGDSALGGNTIVVQLRREAGDPAAASTRRLPASAEDEGDIAQYLADEEAQPQQQQQQRQRQRRSRVDDEAAAAATEEDTDDGAGLATMDESSLLSSFRAGALAALSRGPLTSNPLTNLHLTLSHPKLYGPELSTPSSISLLVTTLLKRLLVTPPPLSTPTTSDGPTPSSDAAAPSTPLARTTLMEPVMHVRLVVSEKDLGKVVSDLTNEQDGTVLDVEHALSEHDTESSAAMGTGAGGADTGDGKGTPTGEGVYIPSEELELGSLGGADAAGDGRGGAGRSKTVVHAAVPLARLVRYSSRLRALTGGNGTFDMRLSGFMKVSKARQAEIMDELGR